ncbi:MAG: ABC transporter ATP-binding protein [Anaerolineaceae bacterium]|nr:ABC transporter ATP-binding protein [Anaerolineaceae bacterium]
MENSISVKSLSHRFGDRYALRDISYEVKAGEVFALLGPNGAGKTTTIRLLNGLYRCSTGQINVLGLDPADHGLEIRQQTGVLTETNALYERLSARENLHFFGTLYGLPESVLLKRTEEILQYFGLEARADDRVGTYSKGMKQRLSLARAFFSHPRILFLDEPTSSLDPESALQVHEMINNIRQQDGHTVFLCTHHLDEAQKLADRVAILNSGRLLAIGSVAELNAQFNPGLWVEVELMGTALASLNLAAIRGVLKVEKEDQKMRVQVAEEAVIPSLVNELVLNKAAVLSIQPHKSSLEEIYFKLQDEAREGAK